MKTPHSLSVQSQVLGEALSNTELEALLDKVSYSPRVSVEIARCKSLVCRYYVNAQERLTNWQRDLHAQLRLNISGKHQG